jgi:hypothetical protein
MTDLSYVMGHVPLGTENVRLLLLCRRFVAEYSLLLGFCRLWRDKDGAMCFQGRWWALPEETADGRQQ